MSSKRKRNSEANLFNNIYKRIQFAIQKLSFCDMGKVYGDYTNPETRFSYAMTTCGYTAPGLTFLVSLFDGYNISNEQQLIDAFDSNQISIFAMHTQSCVYVKNMGQLSLSINNAIGHIWDLHYPFGHGIMHHINDPSWMTTSDEIQPGANMLSIVVPDGTTIHHSFVYRYNNQDCFLVDSWSGEEFQREIMIRSISLETLKNNINNINDKIMEETFLGPPGNKYPKLIVKILKQDIVQHFLDYSMFFGCVGMRFFGGRKRRRHKQTKKRKNYKKTCKH